MTENGLVRCPVVFNEFEHTYVYQGRELSGVTALLKRTLFCDKYLGIDCNVMEEARQRGTLIHEQIELYESIGAIPAEAQDIIALYRKLKDDAFSNVTISRISTEYLISNLEGLATSADLVYEYATSKLEREFCLIDIKTTAQLDTKYLQWQLSIEAYLFEMQNPGCKVVDLSAMWFPKSQYGQPKVVDVNRVPVEEIERLIEADKHDEEFIPESEYDTFEFQDPYIDLDRLIELRQQKEEIENEINIMLSSIKYEMDCARRYTIRHTSSRDFQTITISNRQETTRVGIDAKLLKDKYPKIFEECSKTSTIKGSVSVKINQI